MTPRASGTSRLTRSKSGAPAARNGSCSRSRNACRNSSASPVAIAAPSSIAAPALTAASACAIVFGSAVRDSAVDVRSEGTTAIASAGSRSAMRRTCGSSSRHAMQTPPLSTAARLSMCDSRRAPSVSWSRTASARPLAARAGDQAEADRGRARAEPTLEWDRVREAESVRVGRREERERLNGKMRRVTRKLAAPSPSISTAKVPSSISTWFQRSSAAAAASNPGPRFAVEAGARATIMRAPRAPSRATRRRSSRPTRRPPPCP